MTGVLLVLAGVLTESSNSCYMVIGVTVKATEDVADAKEVQKLLNITLFEVLKMFMRC